MKLAIPRKLPFDPKSSVGVVGKLGTKNNLKRCDICGARLGNGSATMKKPE